MNPRVPEILREGLLAFQQQGDHKTAQRLFREAMALEPRNPDASHLLGASLFFSGERTSGIEFLRKATELGPAVSGYHKNLGNALSDTGRHAEALEAYRTALALSPTDADIQFNIGNTQRRLGRLEQAIEALEEAVRILPEFVQALDLLGRVQAELGNIDQAERCYDQVIAGTGSAGAKVRKTLLLPPVLRSIEHIEQVREGLSRRLTALEGEGLRLQDPLAEVGSTHFYLSYHGRSSRDLHRRIAAFYLQACPELAWTAPHCREGRRRPGKIRVGFISRFLGNHSIGKTTHGLVEQLDRGRFHAVALFVSPGMDDPMSARIAAAADESHVLPADLAAAREAIAALELDVLFYQDIGMEPFTYFLAFARLAPVQCTSFGHPDTTGIPNMDYFISSDLYEPEEAQDNYSEKLVRLPGAGTLAFYERPPFVQAAQDRSEVGLPGGAHIYLCPQTVFKLHPAFDAIVLDILRRDPLGLVILVAPEINRHLVLLQERLQRSLGDMIARVGVVARRDRREFIRLLKAADVMLDTVHFNGMNTSLEALSVGLPVVTLPGGEQRARHTAGMYAKMEYPQCVARDAGDYVDIAVRLATDSALRDAARESLIARSGRLFSDETVVRAFEGFFADAVARVHPEALASAPAR
jgi:predicted O-linked N-acetylglucosamine transferase (SPINDLY family)